MSLTSQNLPLDDSGQVGALSQGLNHGVVVRGDSQELERAVYDFRQAAQRMQDAFPLKGLSFTEGYVSSRLVCLALLDFKGGLHSEHGLAMLIHLNRETGEEMLTAHCVFNDDFFDAEHGGGGDQHHVLVRDVEFVKAHKVGTSAAGDRLYRCDDEIYDLVSRGHPKVFMTSKGASQIILCPSVNWEVGVATDCASVGLHQETVGMVERGPQIMYGVADNGGRYAREALSESNHFPSGLRVFLGPELFASFSDHLPENHFQLRDVLIGPFGL